MVLREIPKNFEKNDKESPWSKISNTAKKYAEETTLHGFSYIANNEHPTLARFLWVIVVILGISYTAFQMVSLRQQWEVSPVVTNLETIAFPIEEIEFPAVTICPQGSVKDVLDNVMFRQLKEYVKKKGQTLRSKRSTSQNKNAEAKENPKEFWNVTYDEMMVQIKEFMNEVYPGAKDTPTEFVKLMALLDFCGILWLFIYIFVGPVWGCLGGGRVAIAQVPGAAAFSLLKRAKEYGWIFPRAVPN